MWIALAALASLVAIVQTARIAWAHLARRWTIRARARRAVEGELRAEPMLRAAGYEVLERQARGGWTVYADGEPLESVSARTSSSRAPGVATSRR